jgi:hypothetical protein
LFALAHEPKQFVRFPEGGHNDLDNYGAIEGLDISSALRKADGRYGLAHSQFPHFEDIGP